MLEGRDRVPWADLTHAYGPAADVPRMLRALPSADQQERDSALFSLDLTVCHQGSICEASPHVVPFLIELIQVDAVRDKDTLLQFLAQLDGAGAAADVDDPFPWLDPPERTYPEYEQDVRNAREWGRAPRHGA